MKNEIGRRSFLETGAAAAAGLYLTGCGAVRRPIHWQRPPTGGCAGRYGTA